MTEAEVIKAGGYGDENSILCESYADIITKIGLGKTFYVVNGAYEAQIVKTDTGIFLHMIECKGGEIHSTALTQTQLDDRKILVVYPVTRSDWFRSPEENKLSAKERLIKRKLERLHEEAFSIPFDELIDEAFALGIEEGKRRIRAEIQAKTKEA